MTTPPRYAGFWLCLSLALLAAPGGCAATTAPKQPPNSIDAASATSSPTPTATIPLLINGAPVGWETLTPLLAEAAGRVVVDELVLESALRRELRARGLTIDDADVNAERDRWTTMLKRDDIAADTEIAIRHRRGLGPDRFGRLLWRNAALRVLLDPSELEVSDEEIRFAIKIRRGRRYAVSGIITPDSRTAIDIAARAHADGRGALAAMWSDAVELGIKPWHAVLSPLDPATPGTLGRAITSTPVGTASGVFALDDGYGLIVVHAVIERAGSEVLDSADLHETLREELVVRKARIAMERLATRLVENTPSHALDRSLFWVR